MPNQKSSLDTLEFWLDRAFRVPGTNYRFGLDALIGLIPGVGDLATGAISGAFVLAAMRQGAPIGLIMRMCWNILVDLVLGAIPLVGDLFDLAHKANTKNLPLLKEWRARQKASVQEI